jgi:hypothetical protein
MLRRKANHRRRPPQFLLDRDLRNEYRRAILQVQIGGKGVVLQMHRLSATTGKGAPWAVLWESDLSRAMTTLWHLVQATNDPRGQEEVRA